MPRLCSRAAARIRQTVGVPRIGAALNITLTPKGKALVLEAYPFGRRHPKVDAVRGISAGDLELVAWVLARMKANLRERAGEEAHPVERTQRKRLDGKRKAIFPSPGTLS